MAQTLVAIAALCAVVANVTVGCSVGLHCAVMHGDDPDAIRAHLGGHHHGGRHVHRHTARASHGDRCASDRAPAHGPDDLVPTHDPSSDHHPGDHWQFMAKLPQADRTPDLAPCDCSLACVRPSADYASRRPEAVADRSAVLPARDRPIDLRVLLL